MTDAPVLLEEAKRRAKARNQGAAPDPGFDASHPPPANGPEDYGAPELPENAGQAFDAAAQYIAPIEPSQGKNGAHGPKSRTEQPLPRIADGSADRWLGKEPAPLEFTIEDLVPESMVTLHVADGGAGKSLLVQTAMTCTATGQPFLGKATKPGAAVGIFAEDPDQVLHIRQVRINQLLGIDMEDLGGRCYPISFSKYDFTLWRDKEPTPLLSDLEEQLRAIADLRLLALDTAALLYHGNENDRGEVTAFIRALTGMAERLRIGIKLTAHTSKSSDDSVAKVGSGTTAWIWACRSVIKLESDGDQATLKLIKSNHIRPGLEISLEWRNGVLVPKAPPDSLTVHIRNRQIDRLIFDRVQERWDADYPLSPTPSQAHRYLPKALAAGSDYRAQELKDAMYMHMNNGNLKMDQRTTRTPMGLKVARRPEHLRVRLSTS